MGKNLVISHHEILHTPPPSHKILIYKSNITGYRLSWWEGNLVDILVGLGKVHLHPLLDQLRQVVKVFPKKQNGGIQMLFCTECGKDEGQNCIFKFRKNVGQEFSYGEILW